MDFEKKRELLNFRLNRILEKKRDLAERDKIYRERNKIEFFKPIEPYQSKILEYIREGKKTIILQGANQIGKTVLGAVVVGSFCLGIQPWDKQETVFGRRPVKGRILCSDWEKHASTVIVPELRNWLPEGQYYQPKKNNVGVEYLWEFKTGSTLEIVTNKQDTRDQEGWKGDFVWADEPPERDKYIANKRGLIVSNGLFLLTMTAVSESWILDEIVLNTDPSFASVTEIPIRANPYLTEEGIHSFEIGLREDEKIPRIYGGWLNLVGLVWKSFRPDVHLIDDFRIPTDWPVVPMIDWHTKEPIAVGYYAFDPRGNVYVIDELWRNASPEEIGEDIIRKKRRDSLRITEAFIDPLSKGDLSYIKNMGIDGVRDTFNRLKDKLWYEGIELKVASKDKDSGIKNVEDMLKGLNGLPSLYFFRNALSRIEKEGHIWEIQRWTYDEHGKPRDDCDHFMENLYRVTLTGTRYIAPRRDGEELKSEIDFDIFT